jgi:multidrug efflux pump subunit AcrA (membrane-fusion protein)
MNTRVLIATYLLWCGMVCGCTKADKPVEKTPTPVKVEAVQSYSASNGARYSASIVAGSEVELSFSVGGYLDSILQVKGADGRPRNVQQGDSVSRGLVLASVRVKDYAVKVDQASGQLAQAKASLETSSKQVAETEVGAEKARLDFERAEALFATQSMTKSDYDSAKSQYDLYKAKVETARSQLAVVQAQITAAQAAQAAATISKEDTLLRAPIDGLLLERSAEVGELISPGKPAFSAGRHVSGEGAVRRSGPRSPEPQDRKRVDSADQKTRLFEVEVSIPNPGRWLKIGMIASLTLTSAGRAESVAVVPLNAIVLKVIKWDRKERV